MRYYFSHVETFQHDYTIEGACLAACIVACMEHKIAYLMSRFPHLPETFILREMSELERQGWQIGLYPLIRQKQSVIHNEAQQWIPKAVNLPFMSWAVFASNLRTFARNPRRYLGLFVRTLWENRTSLNFLLRTIALFPKAVYAGHLIQQDGITHIHAHYATHPALVAWIIHNLTGISYSITVHAHDIFVRTEMLPTKLHDASFIIAISEYNREYLAKRYGGGVREKTYVIHCGINPAEYVPFDASVNFNESFPKTRSHQDCLDIIHIGSLQLYKGQRFLVEACALLRQRNIPFHCRIIGGGEESQILEQQIKDLGLQSEIELLGPQSQEMIARLLPTADCYVQPSVVTPSGKMEGIPVSLMEAMACQLPVIATAISGIPELVRPEETGYLVPPEDPQALADAFISVYEDADGAARRAKAGRFLVLAEFELSSNVAKLSDLFHKTIQDQQN